MSADRIAAALARLDAARVELLAAHAALDGLTCESCAASAPGETLAAVDNVNRAASGLRNALWRAERER